MFHPHIGSMRRKVVLHLPWTAERDEKLRTAWLAVFLTSENRVRMEVRM